MKTYVNSSTATSMVSTLNSIGDISSKVCEDTGNPIIASIYSNGKLVSNMVLDTSKSYYIHSYKDFYNIREKCYDTDLEMKRNDTVTKKFGFFENILESIICKLISKKA